MAKAISIAVKKSGGVGDPNMNFSLRLAIDKARAVNMPRENIDRAIAKGMGKGTGEELAELTIEAFAPEGVGVIVEVVTDSRNRVVAELRSLIEKHGGSMGEPGSIMYLFEHCGVIRTEKQVSEEIQLKAIDLGMTDMVVEGELATIYTVPESMHRVVTYLEQQGYEVNAILGYRPKVEVEVKDPTKTLQFLEMINDYEDVQEIYANLG